MKIKEYIKVDWSKLLHFLKKFSKEIIIALILAVVAAIALEYYNQFNRNSAIDQDSKAIVTIIALDSKGNAIGQGSGFFVSSDGRVVTNNHVIEGASEFRAHSDYSGAYYLTTDPSTAIIGFSKEEDWALLKFGAKKVPFIDIGDSDKINVGDKVMAIGSPSGMENTISEGIISYIHRNIDNQDLIQFTAPISPGSSGGGLFDDKGKAIGITKASSSDDKAQNINFAVPINYLKPTLKGQTTIYNSNPDYYYSKGMLYKAKKEYEDAIRCFNKAIELDNNYGEAYVDLGDVYYMNGDYNSEVDVLSKAVTLVKDNPDVFSALAGAYEDKKQYDAAIENYKKALSLSPKDKDNLYALGNLYLVTGNKEGLKEIIFKLASLDEGLADELAKILEQMK